METPPVEFIPVEPEVNYSDMSYEDQLNYTQNLKHKILHTLVHSNPSQVIPTDKESVEIILKVTDSMDRTTLSKRKNDIDKDSGRTNADFLANMTLLIQNAKNRNPYAVAEGATVPPIPDEEEGELPTFERVDGEAHIGVIGETYDEFSSRMDNNPADE